MHTRFRSAPSRRPPASSAACTPARRSSVPRQWFKDVWDEGQEEAIDRLMAPDGKVHGLTGLDGPPMIGPAAFKPLFQTFRGALGDLEIVVEQVVSQGEFCTAYCRVKGRHVGPHFGGPPTGRPVDFHGMTIARVRDGKLIEGWNVYDFLTMYQQIGWVGNPVLPAIV